ncbi:hypothetical protein FRB93_011978 [Tulasnella sp. JGI-2019a]|nr:hypothetical protein FRB93_011978 [Tulasnella sp. JGI-2019a]
MSIPASILRALHAVEPDETYSSAGGSRITSSKGVSYFSKTGSSGDWDQWNGEAKSLKAMYAAAPGLCPKFIAFGDDPPGSKRPYMISEYMDISGLTSTSGRRLAQRLALELHEPTNSQQEVKGQFGFSCPTYCGVTRLENGWFQTWEECFTALMKGLVAGIRQRGSGFAETIRLGDETIEKVIPHLLSPSRLKDVQPVILHGDLWSGNVGTLASGDPGGHVSSPFARLDLTPQRITVIYDPSSYYGHNEADLAIARMFGGFPSDFWSEYHKHRPKTAPEDEYDERQVLYELFHYLNHTLIFGGGYASASVSRMKRLLWFVQR